MRVSGDPRLTADPRVAALAKSPREAVANISYRDLYAFRPIKDEQGTRDRPHEMTVEYHPEKIDAMLAAWARGRGRLIARASWCCSPSITSARNSC